jgi:hypothetical protein
LLQDDACVHDACCNINVAGNIQKSTKFSTIELGYLHTKQTDLIDHTSIFCIFLALLTMLFLQNENPVLGVRDGKVIVVQLEFFRGCEIGRILRRRAWRAFYSNESWGQKSKLRIFQRNELHDSITILPDFH